MCLSAKVEKVKESEKIKSPTNADASLQKSTAENRRIESALASENIRTSNNGLDDEVSVSKKKLLGE
ncbi:MAG: hypothetical protein IJY61_01030 [Candidatus Gastranaerophilales bacterium]|nr:hypothetical protein [Candidatus Gastranaerophilales bacterium]